jgi:hypothetical protein
MKHRWYWIVLAIALVALVLLGGVGGHYWLQGQTSNFGSVNELVRFLISDEVAQIQGDKVEGLISLASEEGKKLETEILTKVECLKYHEAFNATEEEISKLPEDNGHFIVKTQIGKEIYFIEPSTLKYWVVYSLK